MGILAGHTAFLIGSAIEGMLYGAYVVLVGYALMSLTWRRRTDRVDRVLLIFLLGMLIASSVHFFFGLHALVVGFIGHGEEHNGPLNYLASKAVGYPMDIVLATNLILSDMTMMHRLWLVWQKKTLVLLVPFLMMVSYLTTFAYSVNMMAQGGRDNRATWAVIRRLVLASFSLSLIFSLTVTTLLAYPIYQHTKQFSEVFEHRYGGRAQLRQYRSTILILVESGAMIVMAQATNLAVFEIQYRTGHNIWEMIGLPLNQIYCIVPSLIIVRVALGLSSDQQSTRRPSELDFSSPGIGTAATVPLKELRENRPGVVNGVRIDEESVTKIDNDATVPATMDDCDSMSDSLAVKKSDGLA